jgi:hypothetical protein
MIRVPWLITVRGAKEGKGAFRVDVDSESGSTASARQRIAA